VGVGRGITSACRLRADRLDAEALAARADSLERHRLSTLAQEQLISDLL
jgi:hypothetical protein